jgi:hypothetical protein
MRGKGTEASSIRKTRDQEADMTGATDGVFGETIEPSKPDPKPGR